MKKGFTLAEVLITLAIIGVVAALTIPSVILNTNQTEYKSALKKAVSVLNQATSLRLATENDSPSVMASGQEIIDLFTSQMNTVSSSTDCTAATGYIAAGTAANIGDNFAASSANMGCYFTTTDGMQFWLYGGSALPAQKSGITSVCGQSANQSTPASTITSGSCATGSAAYTAFGTSLTSGCKDSTPCLMVVDVNGEKNPNVMTAAADAPSDRFLLLIAGDNGTSILPAGYAADIMYK